MKNLLTVRAEIIVSNEAQRAYTTRPTNPTQYDNNTQHYKHNGGEV
jgi:hypothetical protein